MIPDTLPWEDLLETAFGLLMLSPNDFWALTPVEFLAAVRGWKRQYGIDDITPPIERHELNTLMVLFPDSGQ